MLNPMPKNRATFSFFFAVLFFLSGLPPALIAAEKETVFVSIVPQKFFVEQIAGDYLEVQILVDQGMSPHAYEPLPQQMAALARSRAFFTIGLPFEKALVSKIENLFPELKIIKTDQGIVRRRMAALDEDSGHEHHAGCDHAAGAEDPHIWLDPGLVEIQAQNITAALIELFPAKKEVFIANLNRFSQQLNQLSDELSELFAPYQGRAIIVFHPAFGYFTDRFGLQQRSIEVEGKEPAPRQLAQIIRQAKAENIRIIFVQQQFSSRAAQTVADAISGVVVTIDPLAEDYFASLRLMAEKISAGLKK